MSTTAVYPHSADGWITTGDQLTWADARGADSGTVDTAGTAVTLQSYIWTDEGEVDWYGSGRAYLPFDTAAIPDSDTISAASLRLRVLTVGGAGLTVHLVESRQASSTALAAADFEKVGNGTDFPTTGATSFGSVACTSTGEKTITLNAAGLALISKTGYTKLALITVQDLNNVTPTGDDYVEIASVGHATESYRPLFTVTHAASGNPPTVTQHPSNDTANEGETNGAVFTAAATDATSQKWQEYNGSSWSDIPGETATTLDFTASYSQNGYQYRCVFHNDYGDTNTNAATLTVTQYTVPTVTTHPQDATGRAFRQSTQFTAAATGNPTPTVQWQRSVNGGANYYNIGGETSDTLTINAIGNGYKYRAVYTNSQGSATSNAATLSMSGTMGAGSYDNADINEFLAKIGSTAVSVTGAVVGTTSEATIDLDNPDLVISGNSGAGSFEAEGFVFFRFKTIADLDHIYSNVTQALNSGFCLFFPSSANFSAITTPKLDNCGLQGLLQFGDDVTNDYYTYPGDPSKRTPPNVNGLVIEDCTVDTGIVGYVSCETTGLEFLRCSGVLNPPSNCDHPISIGGNNLHFTICSFEVEWCPVILKVSPGFGWGKSIVGLHVSGCTFTGGHEEQVGMDAPLPVFNGHVTSVGSGTLTVAIDHDPGGKTGKLTGTTAQVGRHLLINSGAGIGRYFAITAQNDATLTLTSAVYDLTGVQANDRVTVACAMVDSVWDDNGYVLKRGFRDRGYGCNVGFSMHGNCYGNTVSISNFTLPTPLTLNTALPAHNPPGPDIVAADYAVAINETGVNFVGIYDNCSGVNAHNTYEGNTIGANIPVAITVQTLCYAATESPEALRPIGYGASEEDYSYGLEVTGNTYDANAIVEVIDVKSIVWGANTTSGPETHYTGKTPHDYTVSHNACYPYTQADAYVDDATYSDPAIPTAWDAGETDYLWEYHFTLNAQSGTTWAFHEPTNVVAVLDGDHVDVSFDDYEGNDGIWWKRKVDGGAYGEATQIANPTVTGFADSDLPEGWDSFRYAVASYIGGTLSDYVESNVLRRAAFDASVAFDATASKAGLMLPAYGGNAAFSAALAKAASCGAAFDGTAAMGAASAKGALIGAGYGATVAFDALDAKRVALVAAYGGTIAFDTLISAIETAIVEAAYAAGVSFSASIIKTAALSAAADAVASFGAESVKSATLNAAIDAVASFGSEAAKKGVLTPEWNATVSFDALISLVQSEIIAASFDATAGFSASIVKNALLAAAMDGAASFGSETQKRAFVDAAFDGTLVFASSIEAAVAPVLSPAFDATAGFSALVAKGAVVTSGVALSAAFDARIVVTTLLPYTSHGSAHRPSVTVSDLRPTSKGRYRC